MKYTVILITLLHCTSFGFGQLIEYLDFIRNVHQYHPAVQVAQAQLEMSEAALREKQGITDPTVSWSFGNKSFNNQLYYEKLNFKISLPTALGADLFVGYDQNNGYYLDPELTVPGSGQYLAGIEIPLGPELIYNARLMAIRQAKLSLKLSNEERRYLVNGVLYQASLAYLNWSAANTKLVTQDAALMVAQNQFKAVKLAYQAGDRPAIDTVEANLQVQLRKYQLNEAQNDLLGARLILETYLWNAGREQQNLNANNHPQTLDEIQHLIMPFQDSFLIWKHQLQESHPILQIKALKLKSATLDRQQAISSYFPSARFKVAHLTAGNALDNALPIQPMDRMVGVELKYPLLLRKSRAYNNLASAKMEREQLELSLKSVEITNEISKLTLDYELAQRQYVLYNKMTDNYEALLNSEKTKYDIGESSVFLLNARENKLYDAQIARIDTQAKLIMSALKVAKESVKLESALSL